MKEPWWTNEIGRRHLYDKLTETIFTEFLPHMKAGDEEGNRAWQLANAIRVALQLEADPGDDGGPGSCGVCFVTDGVWTSDERCEGHAHIVVC